jgi:5-hydroxyisourate hydrolase
MITTHVLDLSSGRPADGVQVSLARVLTGAASNRTVVGSGVTDADGRLRTLVAEGHKLDAGPYELTFETEAYFARRDVRSFYPRVTVTFHVTTGESITFPC